MKTRLIALILPVFMSLSLVSCQTSSDNNYIQLEQQSLNTGEDIYKSNDDILDSGPVKGGLLNLFSTIPDTLNPLLTQNSYVNDFLGLFYEGLVRLNEKQSPIPVLSDSWYNSEDGLIWNFHIRDGIRWSDGKSFSAEDVAYTVDYLIKNSTNSVYSSLLQNITTFAAIDSSNFKIVLKKPDSFTAEKMTFPIIPKHLSDSFSKAKDNKPVGTGPYICDTYEKNKYILLKKNDEWWYVEARSDKSSDIQFFDSIKVKFYNKSSDAINAFQTGEIDSMSVSIEDFNKYEGRTDLYLKKYISRDFEFLSFNMNNPVLADISVRKAISAAIDKGKIIKEVYGDDAILSDLPITPDTWIFDNKNSEAAPGLNSRDILLEGGWKEKTNGFRKNINGVNKTLDIELLVNDNNSSRVMIAEKICEQLVNAGITATVVKLTWKDMFDRIDKGKFDMVYSGCRITQVPDLSFLYSSPYISDYSSIQADKVRNISGYNSATVNNYIELLYKENDLDAKKNIYSLIKTELGNDLPYLGFCFLKNGMIYRKNIRGRLEPYTWNRYYDITGWYKPVVQ
jgi:ABC-type dipeptide transport system, periplasmic component